MIAHFYAMVAHFLCESLADLLFLPLKFWYIKKKDYFRGILKNLCYELIRQISQKIFAAYGAERGNAPALLHK